MLTPSNSTHWKLTTFDILQKSDSKRLHCLTTFRSIVDHSDVCNFAHLIFVFLKYNLSQGFRFAPDKESAYFLNNISLQVEHWHFYWFLKQINWLQIFKDDRNMCLWLWELCLQVVFDFQVRIIDLTKFFFAQNHALRQPVRNFHLERIWVHTSRTIVVRELLYHPRYVANWIFTPVLSVFYLWIATCFFIKWRISIKTFSAPSRLIVKFFAGRGSFK